MFRDKTLLATNQKHRSLFQKKKKKLQKMYNISQVQNLKSLISNTFYLLTAKQNRIFHKLPDEIKMTHFFYM